MIQIGDTLYQTNQLNLVETNVLLESKQKYRTSFYRNQYLNACAIQCQILIEPPLGSTIAKTILKHTTLQVIRLVSMN